MVETLNSNTASSHIRGTSGGTGRSFRTVSVVLALLVFGSIGAAVAGGGMVAIQSADGSCADGGSGQRYEACGNGTVTDNVTGLIWLADANCFGAMDWREAMELVAGLSDQPDAACLGLDPAACDCGLSDGSAPGEWRLPSIGELMSMVTVEIKGHDCDPSIPNDVGNACWQPGCYETGKCSFHGIQSSAYWSASSWVTSPSLGWLMYVDVPVADVLSKSTPVYVWPVRGGQ